MEDVLFLQSKVKDPYAFYAHMRTKQPVYYDKDNKIWAVYTYAHSQQLLQASQAHVVVPQSKLNQHAAPGDILNGMARLSSGDQHTQARAAAMRLMEHWKTYAVADLLHNLIGEPRLPASIDWVNAIAKRLPALALLKGFGIPTHDALSILPEVKTLAKLMTPVNNDAEIKHITRSIRKVYDLFSTHLAPQFTKSPDPLYFANFIGLLIQSYDATRGVLSYALLHFVNLPQYRPTTHSDAVKFVKESTRLESTVQNTRRYLESDVAVGEHVIKKGEQVLIVLASANRDPARFQEPDAFITTRPGEALTFGSGIHQCIAGHFSIQLAASLLCHLGTKYSRFRIQSSEIHFEPRINVRLPRHIRLLTYPGRSAP